MQKVIHLGFLQERKGTAILSTLMVIKAHFYRGARVLDAFFWGHNSWLTANRRTLGEMCDATAALLRYWTMNDH